LGQACGLPVVLVCQGRKGSGVKGGRPSRSDPGRRRGGPV